MLLGLAQLTARDSCVITASLDVILDMLDMLEVCSIGKAGE